jgi:hypothetical protein
MKTSRANVSRVRNLFRPAGKTATTTSAAPQSKAEFVRTFPTTMSPKDIVQKAKAAGIKLGTAYIYNVWTRDKAGTSSQSVASAPRATHAAQSSTTSANAESLLKAIAAEIGLSRAIDLLQGERARVQSILRG